MCITYFLQRLEPALESPPTEDLQQEYEDINNPTSLQTLSELLDEYYLLKEEEKFITTKNMLEQLMRQNPNWKNYGLTNLNENSNLFKAMQSGTEVTIPDKQAVRKAANGKEWFQNSLRSPTFSTADKKAASFLMSPFKKAYSDRRSQNRMKNWVF